MDQIKNLFKGISVVIDDEIDQGSRIDEIIKRITDHKSHVVKLNAIPDADMIESLNGASFIILDWEFKNKAQVDIPEGVKLGATFIKHAESENIDFLKKLDSTQFIPVFILTDAAVDEIKTKLVENNLIKNDDGDHIFVLGKQEAIDKGLYETLADWLSKHPSAYVLKKWDQSYTKAKNSLFRDFYKNSRFWPVVIWDTHLADEVVPAVELGNLIGSNIKARLSPVDFDEKILNDVHRDQIKNIQTNEILDVLAGERLILEDYLDKSTYTTGDLFLFKVKPNPKEWTFKINIRSECDCVARKDQTPSQVEMTLLTGKVVKNPAFNEYGISEGENVSIIFNIYNKESVRFGYKDISVMSGEELIKEGYVRVGRLTPPYITRMIQRYGYFIQRMGLPKIPKTVITKQIDTQPDNTSELREAPRPSLFAKLFQKFISIKTYT